MSGTTTPFPSDQGSFTVFFSSLSDDQVFLTFVGMTIFALLMAAFVLIIQKYKPSVAVKSSPLPPPQKLHDLKGKLKAKQNNKSKGKGNLTKNQIRII